RAPIRRSRCCCATTGCPRSCASRSAASSAGRSQATRWGSSACRLRTRRTSRSATRTDTLARTTVPAELQILADVAFYRIRRLEMANLAGAFALALALHLAPLEIGVRLLFGLLLNLLVYLNNDFHDRDVDLVAAGRERGKTEFLVANVGAAV